MSRTNALPPPEFPPLPPAAARVVRVYLDLLFGVLLPLACLFFDPVVFGGGWLSA